MTRGANSTARARLTEQTLVDALRLGARSVPQLLVALAPLSQRGIQRTLHRLAAQGDVVWQWHRQDARFRVRVWLLTRHGAVRERA